MIRVPCLATVLLVPTLAWAAAPQPKDCPPLGSLPDFLVDATTTRNYDTMEFERTNKSGEAEPVAVSGQVCIAHYSLRPGKDTPSNLEIQANYKLQLQQIGAEITSAGGRDTYAHRVDNGAETWLRIYSSEDSIETTVLRVVKPKLTLLPPGPGDYRLVGHLPNFAGSKPVTRNFDSMSFEIDDGDGGLKTVTAEGKTFTVAYQFKDGLPELSNPEIRFNYAEALRQKGAEILHDAGRETIARLLDNGQVVWVKISANGSVELSALEEKPFAPSIKPAEMQAALQKAGRIAVYVNFDFDKATLRPDAAPTVKQVVDLLKADPALRLGIEGHTDGMGSAEHNRALSTDRAKSFLAALIAQGIAPDRLTAAGFGPDKPIASNDNSDGRAKNRRVEFVRL